MRTRTLARYLPRARAIELVRGRDSKQTNYRKLVMRWDPALPKQCTIVDQEEISNTAIIWETFFILSIYCWPPKEICRICTINI